MQRRRFYFGSLGAALLLLFTTQFAAMPSTLLVTPTPTPTPTPRLGGDVWGTVELRAPSSMKIGELLNLRVRVSNSPQSTACIAVLEIVVEFGDLFDPPNYRASGPHGIFPPGSGGEFTVQARATRSGVAQVEAWVMGESIPGTDCSGDGYYDWVTLSGQVDIMVLNTAFLPLISR